MWTHLPSSSLRISGADRVDFVHGQMTNDLRGAGVPAMRPACFLNVRGQIEQFARIYKRADDLYIHLAADEAAQLAARFKKYIIFDQVEVQDTSERLSTLHLWDEAHAERLGWQPQGPEVQQCSHQGHTLLLARVARSKQSGVDVHVLSEQLETVMQALSDLPQATLEQLQLARICAGLPDVHEDHWQGLLLQEVGMDIGGPLPCISYRKGCYVGQEIMARLEARGNTRYQLALLRATSPAAILPSYAEVSAGGKVVGQLGLVATGVGAEMGAGEQGQVAYALARLRKDVASELSAEGQPLELVRWCALQQKN